jgi:hypothetical protein
VLDYGAGEALHADIVAAASGELLLCEAGPGLRARAKGLFAAVPNIRVLAPQELTDLSKHSLDLIVLHSVAQYLTDAEINSLLALFHQLLKSEGLLVVSDIIPPQLGAATDAWALLRFGAANGFLLAAMGGLFRTFFSDYRQLRDRVGLTRYAKAAMIEKLGLAGFSAKQAANIGHDQSRMAFHARLMTNREKRD